MKPGSRPSPKKTTSSRHRRTTARERTSLIVLLAAIAVLLGVVVALLPEPPEADEDAVAGGRVDPDEDTTGEAPVSDRDASEVPEPPRDETRPAEDADAVEGPVTEAYPDDEAPPGRAPGAEPPSDVSGEADWWVPDSPPPPAARGPLVLVLDDAGNTLDGLDAFLDLPFPFAVAILPQLDYSVPSAAMAAAAEKEVLLHLPMEAENGANPGPGAILTGLSEEEIATRLGDDLASVPGAIGVNNHMGSKATANEKVMRVLLGALHDRGLFFLDSRTSAATTGRAVAAEVGIPFAERAVFLDHERTREEILRSLAHALELSGHGEPVVMIGHATVPLLAAVLEETYPVIVDEGYEFARLSSLVSPVRVAAGDAE
ncbi:MAG: divergent polysaccharide deacetylase family protein [Spirochaetota bacterium]